MSIFWRELRHGWRLLWRAPLPALAAIVALGLGIGANTAIFSLGDGILNHPLPFHGLERLVMVFGHPPGARPGATRGIPPADFADFAAQQTLFDGFAAFENDQMNLTGLGPSEMVPGSLVSPSFFSVLGVKPIRGRDFVPSEATPGNDRSVILSRALWQNRFAGDPNILGRQVALDGANYTIVGIMGDDAVLPQGSKLWMPYALTAKRVADRSSGSLLTVARLKPGVTPAQAQDEMQAIAGRLAASHPDTDAGRGATTLSLVDRIVGNLTRQYMALLYGAMAFVLLIACTNVANLQFARALGRHHELAVRTALGASRARLIRQLLTENLILGFGGMLVGLVFAWISLRLILACMPADVSQYIGGWDQIHLQGRALAFTILVALAAVVLSGLAPAWQAARPRVVAVLNEDGRGNTGSRARQRLRGALVVLEIALALVLLVGAGLMVKGLRALLDAGDAWQPRQIETMAMNFPGSEAYEAPANRVAFYDRALADLAAIPGVSVVAASTSLPLNGDYSDDDFAIQGQPPPSAGAQPSAIANVVSPSYFQIFHLPILSGRGFTASDGLNAPRVAIVSQSLARHYWPGKSPLGQQIRVTSTATPQPWMTIVGVTGELQYDWSDRGPEPAFYVPEDQAPEGSVYLTLAAGSKNGAAGLAAAARNAILAVDPNQPVFATRTLDVVFHQATIGLAYVAVMMTVAGLIALALAGIGVYGVMSFLVRERRREIGVRMSLGATGGQIQALVLRRAGLLLALGLLLGFPVAFLLARAMAGLVFGVGVADPATFAGIGLLLALIAGLAGLFPARAAARVDPLVALRD